MAVGKPVLTYNRGQSCLSGKAVNNSLGDDITCTGESISCEAVVTAAFKATFIVAARSMITASSVVLSTLVYIYTNRRSSN